MHVEMFLFQAFHVRLSGINGFYIHEICIKQVLQTSDLLQHPQNCLESESKMQHVTY